MYTLNQLRVAIQDGTLREINGQWVAARPCDGPWIYRVKAAWAVLTGKADAFQWPHIQKEFL